MPEVAQETQNTLTGLSSGDMAVFDEGASPEDILGVLRAVAPQVGGPRVVAAAPELMLALGLSLPDEPT